MCVFRFVIFTRFMYEVCMVIVCVCLDLLFFTMCMYEVCMVIVCVCLDLLFLQGLCMKYVW